ncbi:DUF4128 domain-containing protein [uncultured Comamonas sp.]|uniref:DUF4128 domain-containing protein n=1 Tax=uncultured Comamonas sp. TaxID=114710 RepID=UPI0025996B80|nr:DUF4128 domain-containing protein [uncultured Comamonas sp.]
MNPNLIDAALESHLLTLPGAPSIAWEDVAFTPTVGQAYLQVNQLRNTPIDHAESLDVREDRGILQVTVVHPAGGGKVAALELAHKVAQHFALGTRLEFAGGAVTVYHSPDIGTAYPDEGWLRIPVSIRWTTA